MFEYGNFKLNQADSEVLEQEVFRLRYEVYALEVGFENPNDFPDKFEEDEYDQHSVHFAALNEDDDVIGTIRFDPRLPERISSRTRSRHRGLFRQAGATMHCRNLPVGRIKEAAKAT